MNTTKFNNTLEKLINSSFFFNLNGAKSVKSLKNFSYIIAFFALMFIVAYVYKWTQISNGNMSSFKLIFNDINILPLNNQYKFVFGVVSTLEIIKLLLGSLLFFQLGKFFHSLDLENPFKNIVSKHYIIRTLAISILFFVIDAVAILYLNMFEDALGLTSSLRLFHFEYLFIVYFLYVFTIIFKRGVDLHNEIDLVI